MIGSRFWFEKFPLAAKECSQERNHEKVRKAAIVRAKRVYESIQRSDGSRFLVERFWPRGVKKEKLKLDAWLKDVAPSDDLRRWFGHDPVKWDAFQRRYRAELDANPGAWEVLLEATRQGNVTLLYSARDTEHNNAIVLKKYLEECLGDRDEE
jgi:uncharacterized protein YeaO (DUF488 family)